ncbi:MAG: hypothetical protein WBW48_00670 [Anaerolineae bacterium]
MPHHRLVKELKLQIAGLTITARPADPEQRFIVDPVFEPFLSTKESEVIIRVHFREWNDGQAGRKVLEARRFGWELYQRDDGAFSVRFIHPERGSLESVAIMAPDFRTCDLYIKTTQDYQGKDVHPLGKFLHKLPMVGLLSGSRGLLLHSCGINDNGRGMLFVGHSEAGKTTMASLWKGREDVVVLNDEHVIVRQLDGRFRVYGTPWLGCGGTCTQGEAPLQNIFFLEHALDNNVWSIRQSQAVALLMAQASLPLWSREGMQNSLELCLRLVSEVPCCKLGFVPDESVVSFIRSME